MKTLLKTAIAVALFFGTVGTFAASTTHYNPIPHCYPCNDDAR